MFNGFCKMTALASRSNEMANDLIIKVEQLTKMNEELLEFIEIQGLTYSPSNLH
jgi:hypothetical protein